MKDFAVSSALLSDQVRNQIECLKKNYPKGFEKACLEPVLLLVQQEGGGTLTQANLKAVAAICQVPLGQVQALVDFAPDVFLLKEKGHFHIHVCQGPLCATKKSERIFKVCAQWLGLAEEGSTLDRRFLLKKTGCLGACSRAPILAVNGVFYDRKEPKEVRQLLSQLSEKEVSAGKRGKPQNPWGVDRD